MRTAPTSTRLHIEIKPEPTTGGTATDKLKAPGSAFAKAMNALAGKRQAIIFFWVNPDSFNTYLLARAQADEAGVPAGWEVRGNTSYWLLIPDVEVRRLQEPPKPNPNPKPQPPRLKPRLD